jgi:hypothetical protein
MAGDAAAAVAVELAAVKERADWAENACGLAEAYAVLGEWHEVERWAQRALELGMPDSHVPLNPRAFDFVPLMHLAEASFRQGRNEEGQAWLERAWAGRGNRSL